MLGCIQRCFEQGDSIGTGTTSDADWACQGDAKIQIVGVGTTGVGTSRKVWSKGILLAQARLQMQIGHARATRRTFKHHSDMETQRSLFAGKF